MNNLDRTAVPHGKGKTKKAAGKRPTTVVLVKKNNPRLVPATWGFTREQNRPPKSGQGGQNPILSNKDFPQSDDGRKKIIYRTVGAKRYNTPRKKGGCPTQKKQQSTRSLYGQWGTEEVRTLVRQRSLGTVEPLYWGPDSSPPTKKKTSKSTPLVTSEPAKRNFPRKKKIKGVAKMREPSRAFNPWGTKLNALGGGRATWNGMVRGKEKTNTVPDTTCIPVKLGGEKRIVIGSGRRGRTIETKRKNGRPRAILRATARKNHPRVRPEPKKRKKKKPQGQLFLYAQPPIASNKEAKKVGCQGMRRFGPVSGGVLRSGGGTFFR